MLSKSELETKPFIIAEVGQNHQGDLDIAIDYIKEFAQRGASAVKFQMRNNKYLFDEESYNSSYDSENAFANIYGHHRDALELDVGAFQEIKSECDAQNTKFMCTPFDEYSLDNLVKIGVDVLKVASFDIGNLSLIDRMAQTKLPIIMSVGGGKADQIRSSVEQVLRHHDNVAILHCVSEYPCEASRMGLDNIKSLIEEFPNLSIGSSDHYNGTLSGPIAYTVGARVFEKHVTFNRSWKGTDHSFALEPEGFRKFVRDIERTPLMFPVKPNDQLGEEPVFKKLGKSIILNKDMFVGDSISIDDISGRIFKKQYTPVRRSNEVIGRQLLRDIKAGEPLEIKDLG